MIRQRGGLKWNPWETDDEEEENKGLTLSAYSLRYYFGSTHSILSKPASVIRKEKDDFALVTDFDRMTPEKMAPFLREDRSIREFSVVVANSDLDCEVEQAFVRAGLKYISEYHGVDLGISISQGAANRMIDALLVKSPKVIDVDFDVLWDKWKRKNKKDKIKKIEFTLSNREGRLRLIVGHEAKIRVESELHVAEQSGD